MTMGVRFARNLGPVTALTGAQYTTETISGRPALCCPSCGSIVDLDAKYDVDGGGRVTPAWKCHETCSFFDWVVLGEWSEPR